MSASDAPEPTLERYLTLREVAAMLRIPCSRAAVAEIPGLLDAMVDLRGKGGRRARAADLVIEPSRLQQVLNSLRCGSAGAQP